MNEQGPGTFSQHGQQGGVATAGQMSAGTQGGYSLTEADLRQLNRQRVETSSPQRQDGFLAVMLGGTGWTIEQVSTFLGLDNASVRPWINAYREGGLDALRNCQAPQRNF